jgi:hypothetical protein
MKNGQPSRIVVLQRIRNRIIESLELASSFEAQRQYQVSVPYISVPTEVIEQWFDCVNNEEPLKSCPEPVFSSEERQAVSRFHSKIKEVCRNTPQFLPPLEELLTYPCWAELRVLAEESLTVFGRRGRLSEEIEVV